MTIFCPNCSSITVEIRECDRCGKLGCHKCLKKTKNEWKCIDCKNNVVQNNDSNESNIFKMFE